VFVINHIFLIPHADFLTATQVLSHTVIFLLNFISSNAEVQEKIFQESSLLSENPSLEELNKAHYTRAVIQESFRVISLTCMDISSFNG